jgi:oligoribonuclease NrnB/cAMP/cGMP phosphodiesterase (DHH superfamily)
MINFNLEGLEKKKTMLFTHTDLDGIGCSIVGQYYIKHINVEYCNYDEIEKVFKNFLSSTYCKKVKQIFMTDISFKDPTIWKMIEQFLETDEDRKFFLLDHHKLSDEMLNNIPMDYIQKRQCYINNNMESCGTKIFYNLLKDFTKSYTSSNLQKFVDLVWEYDTFNFVKIGKKDAENLNFLLSIKGRKQFIEDIFESIDYEEPLISENERELIKIEDKRKLNHVKNCLLNIKTYIMNLNGKEIKLGYVFTDQYVSYVGNYLSTEYPDKYDAIVLIGKEISFRTSRDDFDCSILAKMIGGGGREKTAGAPITDEMGKKIMDIIFNNEVKGN